MATKSPDAFRTISEVAEWLDTPAHVLRFWESRFAQVKPVKRAGGRRYYRPNDMLLLGGIKKLLHEDGMTIKGVQKMLRTEGIKKVSALSQPIEAGVGMDSKTIDITAEPADSITETAPDSPVSEPQQDSTAGDTVVQASVDDGAAEALNTADKDLLSPLETEETVAEHSQQDAETDGRKAALTDIYRRLETLQSRIRASLPASDRT